MIKKMHATTPLEKSETVLNFCSEIVENSDSVFIDVTPKSDSIIKDCFINVEKVIRKKGGEIVYGWQIWEWPNVMIEAEFHAVWLDKEGLLHDVTPKPNTNIHRILFVADNSIKYEEKQVNNIRKALTDDWYVHEFIKAADDEFEFLNRGDRADQHQLILDPEEQAELKAIREKKNSAYIYINLCQ